jgi:hypothetical protein
LAHVFPWEYSHKGLQLAQLLGQLGGFLTFSTGVPAGHCGTSYSAVFPPMPVFQPDVLTCTAGSYSWK